MRPLAVFTCIICLVCVQDTLHAQISDGGIPVSFSRLTLSGIETVITPPVDVAAMVALEEIEAQEGLPFRFGKPFDVDYDLDNSGTWDELPDGGRIWRLRIESPGAQSINLLYSRYHLPPGARLFLYDGSRGMIIGAFTERNNKDHGQFATGPIRGDVTIVEYYEPAEVRGKGELAISRIVHAYKDIFDFNVTKEVLDFGDSGPCNNNVNCPEGEPWQDEIRSVAMILTGGGFRLCTGALVNNVRQDETPYFLTANHCLGGETSWIFMFNYQSPTCANIDGPTTYTVSGCTKRANYSTSDFALLELSEQPPDSYNVYFAGWSNIDTPSLSSTGIHHPSGDIKKISFDYDPVTSTDYLGSTGTTHWRIGVWDDGTTEPGSSGSPLYDQNHHIVGQLHGGYASCTSLTSDWYGKFALSWNGGGSAATRLRDWLDPDNTSATVLDGFDPYAGVAITHAPLEDTRDTLNDYEVICLITSNAELLPNQLLLHYQLASTWYDYQLQPTGTESEYHGFIPAQPAGTTINYLLTAADINGSTDTAGTFSFFVDYSPGIAVTPGLLAASVLIGDSTSEDLIVESAGNGELIYTVTIDQQIVRNPLFTSLLEAGEVEPARREYPDDFADYVEAKGEDDPRDGFPVTKNAGGPDNFGYVWIDSDEPGGPLFDWVDISGTGTDITAGLDDDNYVGPYPLGFEFPYYGNTYAGIYIGSNGIIGFDTTNMKARLKTAIPTATAPNNILAWLWDDLDITNDSNTNAHVYYESDGSRFIVQYVDYPEYRADPGDVVTAQVILDSDGTITFQYLSIASGFDTENCAVGIENQDGTDGLEVAYLTPYLHDNLAVQFFMPYQWLTLDRMSGTIPPGQADTITCTFTSTELDSGLYYSDIVITSNDPDPEDNPWTVAAELTVIYAPPDIDDDGITDSVDNCPTVYNPGQEDSDFDTVGDSCDICPGFDDLTDSDGDGTPDGCDDICGDANGDRDVNVADAVYVINFVFKKGPVPDPYCAGDANLDGSVNVADAVYVINFVFKEGPPPVEPCCF